MYEILPEMIKNSEKGKNYEIIIIIIIIIIIWHKKMVIRT